MSTISGRYVKTFAEASHALPQGMHMNADYPFMLPRVVRLEGSTVVLKDRLEGSFAIRRCGDQEHCIISQSSSFEELFSRKPTKFKALPFKDDASPAIGKPAP